MAINSNLNEPPTRGQPPKRGQKLCSQSVLYSEVPLYPRTIVPYSTEMTPTLIACYKAATGMGLISKTVVLPRN